MREARIVDTPEGKQADGEGWFILNLADVAWQTTQRGGTWSLLETETAPFGQFGEKRQARREHEKPLLAETLADPERSLKSLRLRLRKGRDVVARGSKQLMKGGERKWGSGPPEWPVNDSISGRRLRPSSGSIVRR